MRTISKIAEFIFVASTIVFASNAYSADKTITVEGLIKTGSLDSGIETENGDSVGFLTNSDIGNRIFKECGDSDAKCKVIVIIDDNDADKWIKNLVKVESLSEISTTNQPSFDCSKSSTYVEKTICSNSKLSELDRELMEKYKESLKYSTNLESLKNGQRDWLKNVRNKCQNNLCIEKAYKNRLSDFNVNTSNN